MHPRLYVQKTLRTVELEDNAHFYKSVKREKTLNQRFDAVLHVRGFGFQLFLFFKNEQRTLR